MPFLPVHGGPFSVVRLKPCKRKSPDKAGEDQKRRKTKWNVEPLLTRMRTALRRIRIDKVSTTEISKSLGIPTRTLRRYVNFSKDPGDKLFYVEVEEEEQEDEPNQNDSEDEGDDSAEESPISWKPRTAVPMFTIWTGDSTAVSGPKSQPQPESTSQLDHPVTADTTTNAADLFGGVDFDRLFPDATTDVDAAAGDLFDSVEFDLLFQDFCQDYLV